MDLKFVFKRFLQMYLVLLIIGFLLGVYDVLAFSSIISAFSGNTINPLMFFLLLLTGIIIPFVFISYFKIELKEALVIGLLYSVIPFFVFSLFRILFPADIFNPFFLLFNQVFSQTAFGYFVFAFCLSCFADCVNCVSCPVYCSDQMIQLIVSTLIILISVFVGTKIRITELKK